MKKILVAVDFSPCSKRALTLACDVAKRYDAELTLLHGFQAPGLLYPDGFLPSSPQVYKELADKIDQAMADLKGVAQDSGVARVTIDVREGNAAEEIVRAAEEGRFDLIVIGTHGHRGLAHALLGSVAEHVVRRAPCPVLSVRSAKEQAKTARTP